jgi:hypothetical protein
LALQVGNEVSYNELGNFLVSERKKMNHYKNRFSIGFLENQTTAGN